MRFTVRKSIVYRTNTTAQTHAGSLPSGPSCVLHGPQRPRGHRTGSGVGGGGDSLY